MATAAQSPAGRSDLQADPLPVTVYAATVSVVFFLVLWALARIDEWPPSPIADVASFALVGLMADALRVRAWREMSFSLSAPVVLAGAFVLTPVEAAIVGFAATADIRELRREIPLPRALFNRSQIGLSVAAASLCFHGLGGSELEWPALLGPATCALLVDAMVNAVLVLYPASRIHGASATQVVRRMYGPNYLVTGARFACVALMAPLMAIVWASTGTSGLLIFLMPVGLAWLVLRQAQQLEAANSRVRAQNLALAAALDDAAAERREERSALAGELHDEVLPALFNVDLTARVIAGDLADGRLLQLEEDVPRILESAGEAQRAIRDTIDRSRKSSFGPSGLVGAFRAVGERIERGSGVAVMLDLEEVDGAEGRLEALYLAGREAIVNAATHSGARMIVVRLRITADQAALSVRDDGLGFDPSMGKQGHFGLSIMSERVSSVGGSVCVDSRLGEGTTVEIHVPLDALDDG